jgi:hypothetical protein
VPSGKTYYSFDIGDVHLSLDSMKKIIPGLWHVRDQVTWQAPISRKYKEMVFLLSSFLQKSTRIRKSWSICRASSHPQTLRSWRDLGLP